MSQPRLLPHLVCSATGAANDNLIKQVFIVALSGWGLRQGLDPEAGDAQGQVLTQIASFVFLVPFALAAPLAGSLGDRWPRDRIARWVRWLELPLVVLCALAFASDRPGLIFGALALMAVQSAFFAPAKLAIVPDLVDSKRVPRANGTLQAVTIVAILLGTGLAAVADPANTLIGSPFVQVLTAGLILAGIGAVIAFAYPRLTPAAPQAPIIWTDIFGPLRALRSAPRLIAPALALGGFWGLAQAAAIQVANIGVQIYGLNQAGAAQLSLALALGIVAGAVAAPRLESRAFPAGLPLIGAFLAGGTLAASATVIALAGDLEGTSIKPFMAVLFVAGLGAGLWEIPLMNLLLQRAPDEKRTQVMAGSGLIGTLAMLATLLVCMPMAGIFKLNAATILAVIAWAAVVLALLVAWSFRRQFGAWCITCATRIVYPTSSSGLEHLPAEGGCVVICNHLSFADGLILGSHLPRPARYLVYRAYLETPVVGWILRIAGAIPIAATDGRRALAESIEAAVDAARRGEVVVIFPEGKISRGGQMDTFRSGMERIAGRAGVPIIPAHLHGLWGSLASRAPRRCWNPIRRIHLRLGPALASETRAPQAREHVMSLSYEAAQQRSDRDGRSLGTALIRQAKRGPRAIAVQDANGTISRIQLVAVAKLLWKRLGIADDETCVGILLPPGRGGAIVNAACAIAGRTAVNLNHTVGPQTLQQLCEIAGLRTIISAEAYLKRIGRPDVGCRVVTIEDELKALSKVSIVATMAATLATPTRWQAHRDPDAVAAIIFSSGSTGAPKGVELTHRQVLANCDAVADALHLEHDVIISPLPLFHSFGLVPGLWLGLVLGLKVAGQPDPMDGKALGKLAEASGATFLLSTPTFVRGYLRRIEPEQFKTLRFAVVGAERCDADLKAAFAERYGADLLEGYGCTELCPVVAVNLPEVRRDGEHEVRAKHGSVGRALPGIQVITVNPETNAILPNGAEGLLVVRSAARMRGYLGRDDLTSKVFIHGGYNTGDIGRIDNDGFIFITGRLARFAKIGGEMVPLDNVETAIQAKVTAAAGPTPSDGDGEAPAVEVAVAAIPDAAKGERLVVMTTGSLDQLTTVLGQLDDLPALMRPKASDAYAVEAIPKLGTGKRDLGAIKRLAEELGQKAKG